MPKVKTTIDPKNPPKASKDDLARFDAIHDSDIDYSDIPEFISPSARASLARIRANVATINRLEGEIAKSRWETVLIAFLVVMGLVWTGSKLIPIFAQGGLQ